MRLADADSGSRRPTAEVEAEVERVFELADYRRQVGDLYAQLRSRGVDEDSWQRWTTERAQLLASHPQSPLIEPDGTFQAAPDYFDYDPTWRVVGRVEPLPDADKGDGNEDDRGDGAEHRPPPGVLLSPDGASAFNHVGTVVFERLGVEHRLGLFWLDAYSGGLFLPFKDLTNGDSTYGAGRYLLDAAKSADLGSAVDNAVEAEHGPLLLDFNFSYHPSCAWNPRWQCPLAPPTNRLDVEVEAGERVSSPGNHH